MRSKQTTATRSLLMLAYVLLVGVVAFSTWQIDNSVDSTKDAVCDVGQAVLTYQALENELNDQLTDEIRAAIGRAVLVPFAVNCGLDISDDITADTREFFEDIGVVFDEGG